MNRFMQKSWMFLYLFYANEGGRSRQDKRIQIKL